MQRHNLLMSWNIPFEPADVPALSKGYRAQESYQAGVSNAEADRRLAGILATARQREYLQPSDLQEVARWKYPGPVVRQLVAQNSAADVKEISRVSFATDSERLRIGALMTLNGVAGPMASVILHFAFPDRYPVLDKRVMRTIGAPIPYQFDRWLQYGAFCRRACEDYGITLRTLDEALWQYDYERERRPGAASTR